MFSLPPSPCAVVRPGHRARRQRGVTLLELIVSIMVVMILMVMFFAVLGNIRDRLERSKCIANLRSLHTGAELYIQEHRMWPQMLITKSMDPKDMAKGWIDALRPYSLNEQSWLCPTVQHKMGGPDVMQSENVRIDYGATMFDTKQQSPYRWEKQPWFVESSNVHGNGQLIIFRDGHVQEMNDFLRGLKTKKPGQGEAK